VPSQIPPVEVPAHLTNGTEPRPEITVSPGTESGSSQLPPMAPPTGPPASGPLPPGPYHGGRDAAPSGE
jgi:hypothetical protein